MRLDDPRSSRPFAVLLAAAALHCGLVSSAPGQRPAAPRGGYKDLGELLQNLPNVTVPALDEDRALALAALPDHRAAVTA